MRLLPPYLDSRAMLAITLFAAGIAVCVALSECLRSSQQAAPGPSASPLPTEPQLRQPGSKPGHQEKEPTRRGKAIDKGGPRAQRKHSVDWSRVCPVPPHSFAAAKKLAAGIVADHQATFYCACPYRDEQHIETSQCGYVPRKDNPRAHRIEWEHIVPAAAFGGHRSCWYGQQCKTSRRSTRAGRACCERSDPEFRQMEADLQNLVPAIGELNADRLHRPYGEVTGEPRAYGACDFEVDFHSNVVEPAASLRGDIARAYLYMHGVYGAAALPLSDFQLERLWQWHREDPPTPWERERNRRIREIQGVGNPLVE